MRTRRRVRGSRVASVLAIAILGCVASCGWLVYPAPATDDRPLPAGARVLDLVASDGVPVHAIWLASDAVVRGDSTVAAPDSSRVIVYFHGNGNVAGDALGLARRVNDRGAAMLLAEYRGYGRSHEGSPSEDGLYRDADAVLAFLRGEGIGPERTVLWGYSLGSGIATEMAVRGQAARLVLQAPFTSITGVGEARFPWAPVRLLIWDRYDNLGKAPRVTVPTLVVHGEDDEIVPFEMGATLAKTIPNADLLAVPGLTHGGGKEFAWVLDRILDFALG